MFFRSLVQCLSRFMDSVRFTLTEKGLLITGVDRHDFLYVEATLSKGFFDEYPREGGASFNVDASRLAKIARLLSPREELHLDIQSRTLKIRGVGEWNSTYTMPWLETEMPALREVSQADYTASFEILSGQLIEEVRRASIVSPELTFSLVDGALVLKSSSGAYHFESKPLNHKVRKPTLPEGVAITVPTRYLSEIGKLLGPSAICRLYLAKNKPLKLEIEKDDVGRVLFFLSSKAQTEDSVQPVSTGEALAQISSTRLPGFVTYISQAPEGITSTQLVSSQHETSNHDYTRLCRRLGLIRGSSTIKLTKEGIEFIGLLESDESKAKQLLNTLALKKVHPYQTILEALSRGPTTFEDLSDTVNASLRKPQHKLTKEELAMLVGIATWCDVAVRELGLYYFAKGSSSVRIRGS
jgi:hypothetical protein